MSERNSGVTITLDDYRDIGALEEALSTHADEVLKSLTTEQQRIAQTLFRRLTERVVGRGDRRRPTKLRDVAEVAGVTNEAVAAVVEEFRRTDRSFLTPPPEVPLHGDTIVDITHESLISLWQTLDGWVDDEARSAAAYDRLKKIAHDWPKDADVLGGINLERALEWRKKQEPTVAWARRYGTDDEFTQTIKFIDASEQEWLEHLKREADRERLARENEIVRERFKEKARFAWKLKILTAALAVFAVIAAVAALVAGTQSARATTNLVEADKQRKQAEQNFEEAKRQKEEADTQRIFSIGSAAEASIQRILAAANEQEAVAQADLAKKHEQDAKAAEAKARIAEAEAEKARTVAMQEAEKLRRANLDLMMAEHTISKHYANLITAANELEAERNLLKQEKEQTEKALNEAKENLKLAQESQTKLNVELKNNLFQAEMAQRTQTGFSADASKIFTFSRGQGVSVWNTLSYGPIKVLKAGSDFLSAAFSSDGARIVTATEGGDIVLTDVNSQGQRRLRGIANKPSKVILSADAKRVAVLDAQDGTAKVVDVDSGKTLASVAGTWSPIVSMSFSEDGRQLAVTALDGESQLAKLHPGQQVSIESLSAGTCRPNSFDLVDFSPRPDLKAKLRFETVCQTSAPQPISPKALTPDQAARLLGPAQPDAKAATTATESQPVNSAGTSLRLPPRYYPADKVVRTERILFNLEQRQANGDFTDLASFSLEQDNPGDGKLLNLMTRLRANGISDDVIRNISADIIDIANKLAEIKGTSEPERIKQQQLAQDLYNQILADLGLRQARIGDGS
jgi:hypothetical protein